LNTVQLKARFQPNPDMKRHHSLVPLSREHHDGLVLAQQLILGRSPGPRSTWPTDRVQQVDRVLAFYRTDLEYHFAAEEAHVFPAVVAHIPDGAEMIRRLVHEHEDLRARIADLARDGTTHLEERLPALGERLKAHIRTEEAVLFERMQQEIAPDVLDAIGVTLREVYAAHGKGESCGTSR